MGNSKIDEGAKFKKWKEVMLTVAMNSIRQRQRNEINLQSTKLFLKVFPQWFW